jgi:hypothetical protein
MISAMSVNRIPPFKNASTAISFAAFIVAGIVPPIRRDS